MEPWTVRNNESYLAWDILAGDEVMARVAWYDDKLRAEQIARGIVASRAECARLRGALERLMVHAETGSATVEGALAQARAALAGGEGGTP